MEFIINGKKTEVEVKRKKIKNLNLRIKDGEVFVSAPLRLPEKYIREFIERNLSFIEKSVKTSEAKLKYQLISLEKGDRETYILGEKTKINLIITESEKEVSLKDKTLTIKASSEAKAQQIFENYAREELKKVLEPIIEEANKKVNPQKLGFSDVKINIRKMSTKWGTCFFKRGEITFSLNLFFAPVSSIRYVVFHEFCHFRYPDHQSGFHSYLESFVPNANELRKKLNEREI